MTSKFSFRTALATIFCMAITIFLGACSGGGNTSELQKKVDELQQKVDQYEAEKALTEKRLVRFDSLDFDFYSGQKWDSLQISHAGNIKVYYPDGSITEGLTPQHIDALKPTFIFAPDTRIKEHPVRFGSGDWTAVIGEMEGTFTQPMPLGNGKTIAPTGKKFKLGMCTIGHWKDGKMIEEYLFWDNAAFMKQIGVGS